MAISGSSDFKLNGLQVMLSALEEVNRIRPGSPSAEPEDLNVCKRELNMLLKMYQNMGMKLWQTAEKEITLTASQRTYTLAPSGGDVIMDRPVFVRTAFRRDSNNIDTPMTKLAWDDYQDLTNKYNESIPIQFAYLPDIDKGTLYLWPVPSTSAASEYTVIINYVDAIDDVDNFTDDLEVEQQWFLALKWNLAAELINKYDVPVQRAARIERNAFRWLEEAMNTDHESETSMYIEPAQRYSQ